MKAILVIELEDDVNLNDIEIRYVIQDKYGMPIKAEVDGCPLRPLPEKYDIGKMREQKGWNACLDEITGESNNVESYM